MKTVLRPAEIKRAFVRNGVAKDAPRPARRRGDLPVESKTENKIVRATYKSVIRNFFHMRTIQQSGWLLVVFLIALGTRAGAQSMPVVFDKKYGEKTKINTFA